MLRFPLALITDELSQDFEQAVKEAAALGYEGAEVRMVWGKNVVDLDRAEIVRVREIADRAGVRILSIASPVFKCTHPEGGPVDDRFQQDAFNAVFQFSDQTRVLDRAIEAALALGAPIIRVFSFWRTTEPARLFGHVVEALSEALDRAAKHGLRIGIENEHACNLSTAAEVAPVLRVLDTPHFGLVWDPANSYVGGENPYPDGYSLVPPSRILHVHAKDGARDRMSNRIQWGPLGDGAIDWNGQLAALANDGYTGAISLETHWPGPDGNKEEGTRICMRKLKELVESGT